MILVYDTAEERNPKILKICRKYLHWTQRSVFHGELSIAQYRELMHALASAIDPAYDSIITYATRSPNMIETSTLGTTLGGPGDII
ncbi:CRISPR-associated endonuclease Cas2 [Streptomyces huasconensis]|uniref:CRISPR-associated endonuclease Cas2 n=1 Tax=Streptomyces huasconensis TaxID=1854574 RepID=UPI0034091EEA